MWGSEGFRVSGFGFRVLVLGFRGFTLKVTLSLAWVRLISTVLIGVLSTLNLQVCREGPSPVKELAKLMISLRGGPQIS